MRFLIVVAALSGCMGSPAYEQFYGEPEIVGSSQNGVQIRSGFNVDPSMLAREHCGGAANLERTEQTDATGYYTISYYSC